MDTSHSQTLGVCIVKEGDMFRLAKRSGPRTPPSSPGDGITAREGNRIQLPKFLRKIQPTRSSMFLTGYSVGDGPGSYSPQRETLESVQSSLIHSPFRAVQHMRELFPLVLPLSPALSQGSIKEDAGQRRLRAVPISYPDLRAISSQHQLDIKEPKPIALLPSPVFSDMKIELETRRSDEDVIEADIEQEADSDPGSPYEGNSIFHSYYGEPQTPAISPTGSPIALVQEELPAPVFQQNCGRRRDVGIVGLPEFRQTSQTWTTRRRPRTYSSEADWLSGNAQKAMLEEWLDMVPHRFQGQDNHQYPDVSRTPGSGDEHEIMQVTHLKGAGKPKVVTISRPLSLYTSPTLAQKEASNPFDRPATPERSCPEISAFSPDTPMNNGRKSLRRSWTLQNLFPAPLTPRKRVKRQTSSSTVPERSSSEHTSTLLHVLDSSPVESRLTRATQTTVSSYASTRNLRTPLHIPPSAVDLVVWDRCQRLESLLECVSQAIETFPDKMLRLDSPSIITIRNQESLDEMHIEALRRIFPYTSPLLLSALAALLIVDLHLSNELHPAPSVLGLKLNEACNSSSRHRAMSDECLLDIPMKARATLGIHLPNVAEVRMQERALRKRAETVSICLAVQGQKMMEVLCGRFDDTLWKTLKVLVDLIEHGNA